MCFTRVCLVFNAALYAPASLSTRTVTKPSVASNVLLFTYLPRFRSLPVPIWRIEGVGRRREKFGGQNFEY